MKNNKPNKLDIKSKDEIVIIPKVSNNVMGAPVVRRNGAEILQELGFSPLKNLLNKYTYYNEKLIKYWSIYMKYEVVGKSMSNGAASILKIIDNTEKRMDGINKTLLQYEVYVPEVLPERNLIEQKSTYDSNSMGDIRAALKTNPNMEEEDYEED